MAIRTTATLVYGKWKKNQKVLSDSSGKDSGSVPIKEEECYYTNGKSYYKIGGSNKKGNNFGKSRKVAVTRKGIILENQRVNWEQILWMQTERL